MLIKDQLKKILSDLIPLQMESIIDSQIKTKYDRQVLKKTSVFVQQITKLNEQIAFIESLIPKLARSPVVITDDEQIFLIRLFLASKLSVPDSMVSILDEYLKNIGLIWDIIQVSLYRYFSVHFSIKNIVVRVYLFQQGLAHEFYEHTYSGNFNFSVKSGKKKEFTEYKKKRMDYAKEHCIQCRDIFHSMSSDIVDKFEQLKKDFLKCSAQFKLIFDCSSIDDFIFHPEQDYDSLNSLLASLLAFELKFLSVKEKFIGFDSKFHNFLKETNEVIEPILEKNYEYEMRDCGDSCYSMDKIPYRTPFDDIRALIDTLNAVLLKRCEAKCDCQTYISCQRYYPQQIVHKLVILTPEMKQKICKCSAELGKYLE